MGRYYKKGQRVIANCGDREEPDWIPGVVVEIHDLSRAVRPYQIELDEESDGKKEWYFPPSFIIDDNFINRRKKGLKPVKFIVELESDV